MYPRYKIVGFTGTRRGMSVAQKNKLNALLADIGAVELHHGDCVGADAEAHQIATKLGLSVCIHPPEEKSLRAFCVGDMEAPSKDYLSRDRDIVNETECLIAAPYESAYPETQNGGTWYTIRHAMQSKRPVFIIFRGGDLVHVESKKSK